MTRITLATVLTLVTVSLASAQGGFGPPNSASSTDPATGVTTTSQLNADGSRTITKTDSDGNLISQETVRKLKPGEYEGWSYDPDTGVEIGRGFDLTWGHYGWQYNNDELVDIYGGWLGERPAPPVGGSSVMDGVEIHVVINPDGSRTITKCDGCGNVISKENTNDSKQPVGGSSYDPQTGNTTTSVKNADGTRTVTRTDANGKETSREVRPAPKPTPKPTPKPKPAPKPRQRHDRVR